MRDHLKFNDEMTVVFGNGFDVDDRPLVGNERFRISYSEADSPPAMDPMAPQTPNELAPDHKG